MDKYNINIITSFITQKRHLKLRLVAIAKSGWEKLSRNAEYFQKSKSPHKTDW